MKIDFTLKGGALVSLADSLRSVPKSVEQAFRAGVLKAEATIKKDFMTVQDGSLKSISKKSGKRTMSKRTRFPGVRSVTGTLRRSVKTIFRNTGMNLEGAIGTDRDYGEILEKNEKYTFLKPGLLKSLPDIRKRVADAMRAAFK